MGGLYWSANLVLNQAFCFFSVYLYNNYSEEMSVNESANAGAGPSIHASQSLPLWETVISLFVISMISFWLFLRRIDKAYLWTFFDTRTGSKFICETFETSVTDAAKFGIFKKNRNKWKRIEPEVIKYLEKYWEKFEEEREDWFDAAAIKSVPEDILPRAALKIKKQAKLGGVGNAARVVPGG